MWGFFREGSEGPGLPSQWRASNLWGFSDSGFESQGGPEKSSDLWASKGLVGLRMAASSSSVHIVLPHPSPRLVVGGEQLGWRAGGAAEDLGWRARAVKGNEAPLICCLPGGRGAGGARGPGEAGEALWRLVFRPLAPQGLRSSYLVVALVVVATSWSCHGLSSPLLGIEDSSDACVRVCARVRVRLCVRVRAHLRLRLRVLQRLRGSCSDWGRAWSCSEQ